MYIILISLVFKSSRRVSAITQFTHVRNFEKVENLKVPKTLRKSMHNQGKVWWILLFPWYICFNIRKRWICLVFRSRYILETEWSFFSTYRSNSQKLLHLLTKNVKQNISHCDTRKTKHDKRTLKLLVLFRFFYI